MIKQNFILKLKFFSLAAGVALLLASCSNLQDGAGAQSGGASGGQTGAVIR
ncbi:MAG: hypothetical protein VZQ47_00380 [Treponema sp.]|nr:hypothetical protein [Treponema sp.]MEE3433998.1 hypothetical protein [Treponema sp.]